MQLGRLSLRHLTINAMTKDYPEKINKNTEIRASIIGCYKVAHIPIQGDEPFPSKILSIQHSDLIYQHSDLIYQTSRNIFNTLPNTLAGPHSNWGDIAVRLVWAL